MSIPESNNLFHGSGPEETLNYFVSRLQARDLSGEEALAILGAVHANLGKRSSVDRSVYQSYSSAMESLRQTMPDVYDYVVVTWGRRNAPESDSQAPREPDYVEGGANELGAETLEAKTENGFNEIKAPEGGLDEAEEPSEPGEVEEKDSGPDEDIVKNEEQPKNEDESEDEEETDEEDAREVEEQSEEPPESNAEISDESVEQAEVEEPNEDSEDSSEGGPVTDENEAEISEESATEEAEGESSGESEDMESEGGEVVEPEETEWPEIEQPSPEEPLEGFEGEEDLTPPED